MKCQNCGKNEVNLHYSSNINGCVTETYLCAECAAKSGYDFGRMFDTRSAIDEFFPVFGTSGWFMPSPMMLQDMFPFASLPRIGIPAQSGECGCDCDCEAPAPAPEARVAGVDDEMKKRRELNAMREQMRIAAEKDDFEKAIELREKIKEMEQ